jgi:hypothetical protein
VNALAIMQSSTFEGIMRVILGALESNQDDVKRTE